MNLTLACPYSIETLSGSELSKNLTDSFKDFDVSSFIHKINNLDSETINYIGKSEVKYHYGKSFDTFELKTK